MKAAGPLQKAEAADQTALLHPPAGPEEVNLHLVISQAEVHADVIKLKENVSGILFR
jgi:hypothetical protein